MAKRLAEAARRDLEPAVRGVEKDVGKLRHQVSQALRGGVEGGGGGAEV